MHSYQGHGPHGPNRLGLAHESPLDRHPEPRPILPILTWAIFAVWMLVVLNISPPGLSFDINTIIRFPLSFPRYLTARIFFGLLSASTVMGTLCILSADIGIAIANPS